MAWQQKLETPLSITCGDGQTYTPLWMNAADSTEYNLSRFEFEGIPGTLAVRTLPKGTVYPLELWFQGDDHLEVSDAFKVSAADKRPWQIAHPYFGNLLVQPISMERDRSAHNTTKCLVPVIETIVEDAPQSNVSPADKIAADKESCDETCAQSYATDVQPKVADKEELKKTTGNLYNAGKKGVKNALDAEGYFNALNNANSYITNLTQEPLEAIRQVQRLINYPAQFAGSVQNRLSLLGSQLNTLRNALGTILTPNSKKLFETQSAGILSAMALTTVTNPAGAYNNRTAVLGVVNTLLTNYNRFISDIDLLQSVNGAGPDSYLPNGPSILQLSNLVSYAISNLFVIASNSRQERIEYLPEDSNLHMTAKRFYGLKADDSTIDELIANNNIGPDELLGLPKGRRIIYYV